MQGDNLQLRELRELLLDTATGQSHISAASGMWLAGETLYVIADDELLLGVFSLQDTQPGRTLTIISGDLPKDGKSRKAAEPDFESLTCLPRCSRYPQGALLALGSGSTEQRMRGMLWPFNQRGELLSAPQLFDLQPLYHPLAALVADLNIEGALVQGDCFKLWQRGNNQQRQSAVIEYDLADLFALIDAQQHPLEVKPQRIDYYDLGEVDAVPLTFTDAFALPDASCLFTAAAENTDNSYQDGECVAAAIGLIDTQRQLRWIKMVQPVYKIEGLSAKQVGEQLQIRVVSDADNPNSPAKLLETYINYTL